jgi:hypothetical protein
MALLVTAVSVAAAAPVGMARMDLTLGRQGSPAATVVMAVLVVLVAWPRALARAVQMVTEVTAVRVAAAAPVQRVGGRVATLETAVPVVQHSMPMAGPAAMLGLRVRAGMASMVTPIRPTVGMVVPVVMAALAAAVVLPQVQAASMAPLELIPMADLAAMAAMVGHQQRLASMAATVVTVVQAGRRQVPAMVDLVAWEVTRATATLAPFQVRLELMAATQVLVVPAATPIPGLPVMAVMQDLQEMAATVRATLARWGQMGASAVPAATAATAPVAEPEGLHCLVGPMAQMEQIPTGVMVAMVARDWQLAIL